MGESNSLFDRLPEAEARALHAVARRRRFKKGEVLFHEGDPGDSVHEIVRGHVAIRMTTLLGDTATLTVLGPGDWFGEQALLAEEARRTASAVSVEGTETLSIYRDDFDGLRQRLPIVDRLLVDLLARQVRLSSAHLLEALYVDAETRVLRRVGHLHESFAPASGPGETVLPFTQDEIASMAGTKRPTTNRVLKAAEEAGLLKLGRGTVTVVDIDGLTRRAR